VCSTYNAPGTLKEPWHSAVPPRVRAAGFGLPSSIAQRDPQSDLDLDDLRQMPYLCVSMKAAALLGRVAWVIAFAAAMPCACTDRGGPETPDTETPDTGTRDSETPDAGSRDSGTATPPQFETEVFTRSFDEGRSGVTVRFYSEQCQYCDEPRLAAAGSCGETSDSPPDCACDPAPWACVQSMRVERAGQEPVEHELEVVWWGSDSMVVDGEFTAGSELVLVGCGQQVHIPIDGPFPGTPKDLAVNFDDLKSHVEVSWSGTTDADSIEVATGDVFTGVNCFAQESAESQVFELSACGVEVIAVEAYAKPTPFATPWGMGRVWATSHTLTEVAPPDECYPNRPPTSDDAGTMSNVESTDSAAGTEVDAASGTTE
jgi:hypothetical protein